MVILINILIKASLKENYKKYQAKLLQKKKLYKSTAELDDTEICNTICT